MTPHPLDHWRDWRIPDTAQSWDARATVLYALGVGCGAGPADDLRYLDDARLRALPTLAVVLGSPGFWLMDQRYGLDWPRILHGEQGLVLHQPLAPAGALAGRTRIDRVASRGPGRGAVMHVTRTLSDQATAAPLATLTETWILRGDDIAEPDPATPPDHPTVTAVPPRPPDAALDLPTTRQSALIYRLSGDRNPLHFDPAIAAAAGFDRPILHGLASFGVAGRALIDLAGQGDPARLRAMRVRFTAPVFPGETIRTEIWHAANAIRFRARALERDAVVLDFGEAELDR